MESATQLLIDRLIQSIEQAEDPGSITNGMMAIVLDFLNSTVKSLRTDVKGIAQERTERENADIALNEAVSAINSAIEQLKANATAIESKANANEIRINTLIDGEGVTAAIDTFNELKAFLEGVHNSETFLGLLNEIREDILNNTTDITDLKVAARNADQAISTLSKDLEDLSGQFRFYGCYRVSGAFRESPGGQYRNSGLQPLNRNVPLAVSDVRGDAGMAYVSFWSATGKFISALAISDSAQTVSRVVSPAEMPAEAVFFIASAQAPGSWDAVPSYSNGMSLESVSSRTAQLSKSVDNLSSAVDVLDTRTSDMAEEFAEQLGDLDSDLRACENKVDAMSEEVYVGIPYLQQELKKLPVLCLNGVLPTVSELYTTEVDYGTSNNYYVEEDHGFYRLVDYGDPVGPLQSMQTLGGGVQLVRDCLILIGRDLYEFDGQKLVGLANEELVKTLADTVEEVLGEFGDAVVAYVEGVQQDVDEVKKDVDEVKKDVDGIKKNIEDTKKTVSDAFETVGTKLDDHDTRITDLEGLGSQALNILDNVDSALTSIDARLGDDSRRISSLEQRADTTDTKVTTLEQNVSELAGIGADAVKDLGAVQADAAAVARYILEVHGDDISRMDDRAYEIKRTWDPNTVSADYMFDGDQSLTYFPSVDLSNCTNLSYCFRAASNLEAVSDRLDTSKCTGAVGVFQQTKIRVAPHLDLSKVQTAARLFYDCVALEQVPEYNLSACKNLDNCFYGCSALAKIDPFLTPGSAWSGSGLFWGCSSLTEIPDIDFTNVTNLQRAFCKTGIYEFNNVIDPVDQWSALSIFQQAVNLCQAPANINWEKCTSVHYAFYGCNLLPSLGDMDLRQSTSFQTFAHDCKALECVERIKMGEPTKIQNAFTNCISLRYLLIENFGATEVYESTAAMFQNVTRWGEGSDENRQSLVDTLLTYSFDRAAAGYEPLIVQLHPNVLARLTDAEKAAITAKGYTLASY